MKYKIALCQMATGMDKESNLKTAEGMIREAAENGAVAVALPEMFNCPYSNKFFRDYAEDSQGGTVSRLSRLAEDLDIYLIGGTIPEIDREEDKVYNTCFILDPKGNLIGKHRKMHLFDIDIQGGVSFKESETLSPGDQVTLFDTEYGKMGVAICYDVRFPELFRKMVLEGAELIFLPGAFNMTTGPAHWDLTMRARALDNQMYLAAISPARDLKGPYKAYGHSCVVSPWGEFCGKLDSREGILYGTIDREYIVSIRDQLPLLKHRRPELY